MTAEPPRWSWAGTLWVVQQLRHELGEEIVADVLDRHREAAGLVLEPWRDPPRRDSTLAARLTSHLTHNWAIQRPLFEAWAALLAELLEVGGFRVMVPNLGELDRESVVVLKTLARTSTPRLVVGWERRPRPQELDARGLCWELPARYVVESTCSLLRAPGAELVELPEDDGNEALAPIPIPSTSVTPETELWTSLSAAVGSPEPALVDRGRRFVRGRFHAFGFRSVVRLGLAFLEHVDGLEPEAAAELHHLVALSAHNQQFGSDGNLRLADFLRQAFARALEDERRPDVRCALLYRLAVTDGRRRRDVEAAATWADAAVSAASDDRLSIFDSAYQGAWARNIRSLVSMRRKQKRLARQDTLEGYRLLDRLRGVEGNEVGARARDFDASQALLAGSSATLCFLAGDWQGALEWRRRGEEIELRHPGVGRYEAQTWVDLHRARYQLVEALSRAEQGLASAREERDAFVEYRFAFQAADYAYRLGRLQRAEALYDEVRSLYRSLGAAEELPPPDLPAVATYCRCGRTGDAERILEAAAASLNHPDGRSEVALWRALIAAAEGRDAEAEARADEAIEDARRSGRREALGHAAAMVGEVAARLGAVEDARDAYGRAVAFFEGGSLPLPASAAVDSVRAWVGLQELEGPRPEAVHRCLLLMPSALRDAEGWWLLPRLLVMIDGCHERSRLLTATDLAQAVQVIRRAARQRDDCAAWHSADVELRSAQR